MATREAFESNIQRGADPGDCWLWTGCENGKGYGMVRWNGKGTGAHRVSYELHVGPIPSGLVIDHLCRNRACVNPDHLEAVTHRENIRRGDTGKHMTDRTHCPQGHPYSGDNLGRIARGERICRTCYRARVKVYHQRRREAAAASLASGS